MNPEQTEQNLREKACRRPLTPAERAQLEALLVAHPQLAADWEVEAALNTALAKLTEKPAPSNLTARVLAEIGREDLSAAGTPKTSWLGWLGSLGWVPRAAVVAVVVGLGVLGYRHHQQSLRVQAAINIAAATTATPLLPAEVLENFDEIFLMPPLPNADTDLLVMMK